MTQIFAALITGVASIAVAFLVHHLAQRREPPITWEVADQKIHERASARKIELAGKVDAVGPSHFGTASFVARESDQNGAVYCHAEGKYRGGVFHVRKGIAYIYFSEAIEGPHHGSACRSAMSTTSREAGEAILKAAGSTGPVIPVSSGSSPNRATSGMNEHFSDK